MTGEEANLTSLYMSWPNARGNKPSRKVSNVGEPDVHLGQLNPEE
jgi:hypothetical protein